MGARSSTESFSGQWVSRGEEAAVWWVHGQTISSFNSSPPHFIPSLLLLAFQAEVSLYARRKPSHVSVHLQKEKKPSRSHKHSHRNAGCRSAQHKTTLGKEENVFSASRRAAAVAAAATAAAAVGFTTGPPRVPVHAKSERQGVSKTPRKKNKVVTKHQRRGEVDRVREKKSVH